MQTTDHDTIRKWVEDRGGVPAGVEDTGREDGPGILRIDFPDSSGDDGNLVTTSWDVFFEKFEEKKLAFVYQEETSDGDVSRFNRFVSRD